MKVDIRNNKDFWAGLMFSGIGSLAIFIAREYPYGSAFKMGPGYCPTLLGGILVLIGMITMIKGLHSNEKIKGHMSVNAWKATIMIPTALVLFGLLLERAGLIPALVVLCLGSAAAGRQFNVLESLLLMSVLIAVSAALFIWGLGLPYPLIVMH